MSFVTEHPEYLAAKEAEDESRHADMLRHATNLQDALPNRALAHAVMGGVPTGISGWMTWRYRGMNRPRLALKTLAKSLPKKTLCFRTCPFLPATRERAAGRSDPDYRLYFRSKIRVGPR
jgi:hypothetical protein